MLRPLIALLINILALVVLYLFLPINAFYTVLLCMLFLQMGIISYKLSELAGAVSFLLTERLERLEKDQKDKIEDITKHFK